MAGRYRLSLVTGLLVLGLASCTTFREDFEDAKKTEQSIKSELGLNAKVAFRAMSGTKGNRTFVVVHLASPPEGDPAKIKAQLTDIVVRNFRAQVDQVTIDF